MEHLSDSITAASVPQPLSAEQFFGPQSQLVEHIAQSPEASPLIQSMITDNIIYQSMLLLLFLAMLYIGYIYSGGFAPLFKVLVRSSYLETLYGERSNLFKRFIVSCRVMGLLLFGLLAVRIVCMVEPEGVDIESQRLMPLLSVASILGYVIYRDIATMLLSVFGSSSDFFKEHSYIGSIYWAIAVVVISPLFLLGASYFTPVGDMVVEAIVILSIGVLILYLFRSFLFFIRQKVSILQWILYLCAVDIFPLSLLVLIWKI